MAKKTWYVRLENKEAETSVQVRLHDAGEWILRLLDADNRASYVHDFVFQETEYEISITPEPTPGVMYRRELHISAPRDNMIDCKEGSKFMRGFAETSEKFNKFLTVFLRAE